ncbi:AAA-like domain-containing protein [Paraburkholderia hospita]|nr:AAA-like domain-containing protein [Paraburkholderia hospita]
MQNAKGGIHKGLEFLDMSVEEQEVVESLASCWHVTFLRVDTFKGARYPFVFLKPTDNIRVRFNMHSEVLCIFNTQPTFDARSLDFVDKVINDFSNRLDKLCVVIASKDNDIVYKIENRNVKESRIFIPFHFSELSGSAHGKEKQITKRLEKFLYTKDLYAFDSPLRTDQYFFGRKAEIQALVGKYSSGENGCVFGLRRIGKTSVLLAVERHARSVGIPVTYIDCSDTKFHVRRWNEALYEIKTSLFQGNGLGQKSGHREDEYTQSNASRCFLEDLTLIKTRSKNRRVLIILDEIESLTFDLSTSEHWSNGGDYLFFWQTIRSLFQQHPDLFTIIISGVNPRLLETATVASKDNPIYRFITPSFLGFFGVEEVREMVSYIGGYMGLTYDEEVFTYLTDELGGHPFLIRQVCSKLHKTIETESFDRPHKISKAFYKARSEKIIADIGDYISSILEILEQKYRNEYDLLKYLALGHQATFKEFAQSSREWITHLEGYGLIAEDNGDYHFRINSLQRVIERKEKKLLLPGSLESKWAEISAGRNEFEYALKKVVKFTLKSQLGTNQAKNHIINAMTKPSQKKTATELEYNKIFEKEIYFLDLKRAVAGEWKLFDKIFKSDKARFELFMEDANKFRKDAHAGEISDADFAHTMSALRWLGECIGEYSLE